MVVINFELFIQPLVSSIRDRGNDTIPVNMSSNSQQQLHVCDLDLFVSGGGAKNKTLMKLVKLSSKLIIAPLYKAASFFRSLERRFEKHNIAVATTNMFDIDPDAKEV